MVLDINLITVFGACENYKRIKKEYENPSCESLHIVYDKRDVEQAFSNLLTATCAVVYDDTLVHYVMIWHDICKKTDVTIETWDKEEKRAEKLFDKIVIHEDVF